MDVSGCVGYISYIMGNLPVFIPLKKMTTRPLQPLTGKSSSGRGRTSRLYFLFQDWFKTSQAVGWLMGESQGSACLCFPRDAISNVYYNPRGESDNEAPALTKKRSVVVVYGLAKGESVFSNQCH